MDAMDEHDSGSQEIEYLGVQLRLAAVVEFIRAQQENTWAQINKCARHYKERAFYDLFPTRRSLEALKPEERPAVHLRAIEMVIDDSKRA